MPRSPAFWICACSTLLAVASVQPAADHTQPDAAPAISIQYLEIVTPDVDATCATLEKIHTVTFSKPNPMLGNARTASLSDGGRIGVRAPMRESENPVVRPYLLVENIAKKVEHAATEGAEIAMHATELPGEGTFAIYIQGGIQYGLWQN